MAVHSFYPFVEEDDTQANSPVALESELRHAARIAVYDDAAAAPRVIVIDPAPVREYLEQISAEVSRLAREQGGSMPFMVIREVVENLIHAYFREPTISILDNGQTIRFSDQGPGIADKQRALEYGTTSATVEMKRYIRGVGSGLPYAQQYLKDHGGWLSIEDNLSQGCIVTISLVPQKLTTTELETPTTSEKLSDSEMMALQYAASHEFVGPTELFEAYGRSTATWSRKLKSLENKGFVEKGSQKHRITPEGRRALQ